MNAFGMLISWAAAWLCISEALHSRTWQRALIWCIPALSFGIVAAGFLSRLKHGQS